MIVLATVMEKDPKTGYARLIVSHGIDSETLQNVVLPQETPQALGAVLDRDLGEWVLRD